MNKLNHQKLPRILPALLLVLVLLVTAVRSSFAATTLVSAGAAEERAHYPTLSRMIRNRHVSAAAAGRVTATDVLVLGDDVYTLSTVKVRQGLMGTLRKGDTIKLLEFGGTFRGHDIGKQLGGTVSLTTAINPRKVYEYRYSGYNYAEPGDDVVLFLEPCTAKMLGHPMKALAAAAGSGDIWLPLDITAGKLTKTDGGRYDWNYPMEKISEMESFSLEERQALSDKLYSMKTIETAVEKVRT